MVVANPLSMTIPRYRTRLHAEEKTIMDVVDSRSAGVAGSARSELMPEHGASQPHSLEIAPGLGPNTGLWLTAPTAKPAPRICPSVHCGSSWSCFAC